MDRHITLWTGPRAPDRNAIIRKPGPGPSHGFSLPELLAVLAVVALMLLLLAPSISAVLETARVTRVKSDLRHIEVALELYYADHHEYPPVRVSCNTRERDHWCQIPPELVEGGYMPSGGRGPMSSSMEDPFNPGHTYKYAAIGPYLLNNALQDDYFTMYVPGDFPACRRPGRYRNDRAAPLSWAIWSLGPRPSRERALHPQAPVAGHTWYGGTGDHGVIARIKSRDGASFTVP